MTGGMIVMLQVDSQEDIEEILGENITPASFENFSCDDVAANSRCYATVNPSVECRDENVTLLLSDDQV